MYASLRTGVDPASPSVVDALATLPFPQPVSSLTICGHSLGGAIVTLLALDLAANSTFKNPTVYTYASPRTGDPAFVSTYDQVVPNTFRIANRVDLVPKLPFPPFYEHVLGLYDLNPIQFFRSRRSSSSGPRSPASTSSTATSISSPWPPAARSSRSTRPASLEAGSGPGRRGLPAEAKGLLLELAPRDAGLPDDGPECTNTQFRVIGHGDGRRAIRPTPLHDDVAATTARLREAVPGQDLADLAAGEDTQPTQRSPRPASRRPRRPAGGRLPREARTRRIIREPP